MSHGDTKTRRGARPARYAGMTSEWIVREAPDTGQPRFPHDAFRRLDGRPKPAVAAPYLQDLPRRCFRPPRLRASV
jgi:hypothetical protein